MDFKNQTILITGSNRGIGKALVEASLKVGAKKIYAAARDVSSVPDFNDDRVEVIELDITNANHIAKAVELAGDINVLLNNAGVADFNSMLEGPMDRVQRDMDVNYFATLAMMRAFIPVLARNDFSAIVNIASIAAFVNFPMLGGYSASKAALFSATQAARIELASKNISVHSVNPGPIDTDMAAGMEMDKATPEDTAKNIVESLKDGVPDIFPDAQGAGMFELWKDDYRKLEAAVAEMHGAG
jgi:NAD(P)-dependent dehydrogenase (short-subunit alcohol dehydrogenase family)